MKIRIAQIAARQEPDFYYVWQIRLLSLLIFLSVTTMRTHFSRNGWIILLYESIFIITHLCVSHFKLKSKLSPPIHYFGFWITIAWATTATLSLLLSPYDLLTGESSDAVKHHIKFVFHIIFFFSLRDFFKRSEGTNTRYIFFSWPIACVVLSALMAIAWFNHPDCDLAELSRIWYKDPPYNAHIRVTSMVFETAAVAILPLATKKKTIGVNCVFYLLGIIAWGGLFWCGGKGSQLGALVSAFVIGGYFLAKRMPSKKYIIALFIMISGGIALAELTSVFEWNALAGTANRTMDQISRSGSITSGITCGRDKLYTKALESITEEKAWLIGLGPFSHCHMKNHIGSKHPHNVFIQFILEWGIMGGSLFLLMLFSAFKEGCKSLKAKPAGSEEAFAAIAIFLSLSMHGITSGTYHHAQPLMYMAIALAFWSAQTGATTTIIGK